MKKTVLTLTLACMMMAGLYSCKKDSSTTPTGSTAVKLLTSSRWTFVKFEYEKNGTWIQDPDAVDADKFTLGFNTDNTTSEVDLVNGEGTTGVWHFSSNDTILTASSGSDDLPLAAYNVTILNASTLQLTVTNPIGAYYTATRLNFTH